MRLTVSVTTIEADVQANKAKLSDGPLQPLEVADMRSEAKRYDNDLETYIQEYHAIAIEEEVEIRDLGDAHKLMHKNPKSLT